MLVSPFPGQVQGRPPIPISDIPVCAGVNEMGLRLYDDPEDSIRLIAERIGPELS